MADIINLNKARKARAKASAADRTEPAPSKPNVFDAVRAGRTEVSP